MATAEQVTGTKSILDFMSTLRWFQPASWDAWRVVLKAIFALPMSETDLVLFQSVSGRQSPPARPVLEAWLIIGRRGGKSLIAAVVAVFLACFRDYSSVLAPGEVGTFMLIAKDRRQARTLLRYVNGLFNLLPALKALVVQQDEDGVLLSNSIAIEIHTCSFKSVRGYTVVGCIGDEAAFWQTADGSANPDSAVIGAIRPAMATVPGSLLLVISSPYARRGELWKAYKDHYGQEGDDVLVIQAPTRVMNPLIPQGLVSAALAKDEAAATAEYLAQFRRDVESFVAQEVVDACVARGRYELPPIPGVAYHAFVDPSGGSQDSFTVAVGHAEQGRVVLDLIRESVPPFSPESVTADFSADLKRYGCRTALGDRYGGEWPRERFKAHGIDYQVCPIPKSDLYRDALPLINSGTIDLLDHPKLTAQLTSLERRTARGGKDTIDHPPNGHDDVINAVAGLAKLVSQPLAAPFFFWSDGQLLSGSDQPIPLPTPAHVSALMEQAASISDAVTDTIRGVTEKVTAVFTPGREAGSKANPRGAPRTLGDIRKLAPQDRTDVERDRLAVEEARARRAHVPSEIELHCRKFGVWFPDDPMQVMYEESLGEVLNRMRARILQKCR